MFEDTTFVITVVSTAVACVVITLAGIALFYKAADLLFYEDAALITPMRNKNGRWYHNQRYAIRIKPVTNEVGLVKMRVYFCEHLFQPEKKDSLSEYHLLFNDKEYEILGVLPRFACDLSFTVRVELASENFRDFENRA